MVDEVKKDRISGSAWNKVRFIQKQIKQKRQELSDWQASFFDPGQELEDYYPDQVNFPHGVIFDFGGFRQSLPIGRLSKDIQREAMGRQREIEKLNSELGDVLELIAHKLTLKRGRTYYAEQINPQNGEISELPANVGMVDIDIDEDDAETIKALEAKQDKKKRIAGLLGGKKDESKEAS